MTALLVIGSLLATAGVVLLMLIAFGGPSTPPPLPSIDAAYRTRDTSGAPPAETYTARDGTALTYRRYRPAAGRRGATVILVHGSSASGDALYELARGFSDAGYTAYVPDIRGHGASGQRGRIDYVGQLEDDLEDLLRVLSLDKPVYLAGFSTAAAARPEGS